MILPRCWQPGAWFHTWLFLCQGSSPEKGVTGLFSAIPHASVLSPPPHKPAGRFLTSPGTGQGWEEWQVPREQAELGTDFLLALWWTWWCFHLSASLCCLSFSLERCSCSLDAGFLVIPGLQGVWLSPPASSSLLNRIQASSPCRSLTAAAQTSLASSCYFLCCLRVPCAPQAQEIEVKALLWVMPKRPTPSGNGRRRIIKAGTIKPKVSACHHDFKLQ